MGTIVLPRFSGDTVLRCTKFVMMPTTSEVTSANKRIVTELDPCGVRAMSPVIKKSIAVTIDLPISGVKPNCPNLTKTGIR